MKNYTEVLEIIKKSTNQIPNNISIDSKGLNQLVTEADVALEKFLVKKLGALIPNSGFITEENTVDQNKEKEYVWIIDPIDGTTNFAHGLPISSVSVALQKEGTTIFGAVWHWQKNEMFYAIKGEGSYLNGQKISVSNTLALQDSLLATGFPYYDFDYMEQYLKVLQHFMRNTHGIRRLGSAAIDLAYTACGRFDGFFEAGLSPWDVAAGILLVSEAGGKVSGFSNEVDCLYGGEIIAANPNVHSAVSEIVNQYFNA